MGRTSDIQAPYGRVDSVRVAKEHQERDVPDDWVGDEGPQDPAPRDGFLLLVHAEGHMTDKNPVHGPA